MISKVKESFSEIKMSSKNSLYLSLIDEHKNSNRTSNLFTIAVCSTKLGLYEQAQINFNYVLRTGGFRHGKGHELFIASAQIEKLPEIYILAGEPHSFLETLNIEVNKYRADPKGKSPMALYAYLLLNIITGEFDDVSIYLNKLGTSKLKDIKAIGLSLKALLERNQLELNNALNQLCLAHKSLVKFGNLREASEGFISLPATAISILAVKREMSVTVENEYLPLGYINFLTSL